MKIAMITMMAIVILICRERQYNWQSCTYSNAVLLGGDCDTGTSIFFRTTLFSDCDCDESDGHGTGNSGELGDNDGEDNNCNGIVDEKKKKQAYVAYYPLKGDIFGLCWRA